MTKSCKPPPDIVAIYDKPETIDRLTIILNWDNTPSSYHVCLSVGHAPAHPQGFSQFGEATVGSHLGDRIEWDDIPEPVREHIIERIRIAHE